MALAPSNSMNVVSATGMYKLLARTTVNGTLQFTSQSQDDDLIDWTINPLIDSPTVHGAFPHLAQLPRSTAEAEAQGINALINLSSRAFRHGTLTVRYRYNERDVQTPMFDATEYVRFDAVPEEIEEGLSPNSTRRARSSTPIRLRAGRAGARCASATGTRGSSAMAAGSATSARTSSAQRSTPSRAGPHASRQLRHRWRRGEGFVETGIDYEAGPGGTQPTLRYYDESDRDRRRFAPARG